MRKNQHHATQKIKHYHSYTRTTRQDAKPLQWLQNLLLASCVLTAIGILASFMISSASAQVIHYPSAAKQRLEQSQRQWHAVVDKKQAPKGGTSTNSCPIDLHHAPVINRLTQAQMTTMHGAYASFASVISAEHTPYFIFGEKNRFAVQALPLDPCKINFTLQTSQQRVFQDPLAQGNLFITAVHGDLVSYQTASGTTGLFNYVTGQFQ